MREYKLKNLLIVPGIIITTILTLVFASISIYTNYKDTENSLVKNNLTIVELFIKNISNSFLSGEYNEVYRQCKALSRSQGIIEVNVLGVNGRKICEINNNTKNDWRRITSKKIFFNEDERIIAGKVFIGFDSSILKSQVLYLLFLNFALSISIIILHSGFYFLLSKTIGDPISYIVNKLNPKNINDLRDISLKSYLSIKEINLLKERANDFVDEIDKYQENLVDYERKKALASLSRQIAHDIRSPITSLNILGQTLNSISNEQKNLLNQIILRINGIAEDVLKKNNEVDYKFNNYKEVVNTFRSIIQEIELKLMDKKVEIKLINELSISSKGNILNIKPNVLVRIIVNLINNSVEASASKILIILSEKENSNFFQITISDNGCGIEDKDLEKLGFNNFNTKKSGGSGIGVSYAFNEIKKVNGDILIDSKLGVGTDFVISIPIFSF